MIEGHKLRTLRGHSGKVYHASFSPDGRAIATASYDNTVKLWKPDGSMLATLEGHSDGVLHVSFSPDGQTLTTASYDGTIKLWTLDGTLISTLRGHRDGVNAAVCSPDGQTLATASNDHTVLLWTLTQMSDLDHLLSWGCTLLQDYRRGLYVLEQVAWRSVSQGSRGSQEMKQWQIERDNLESWLSRTSDINS